MLFIRPKKSKGNFNENEIYIAIEYEQNIGGSTFDYHVFEDMLKAPHAISKKFLYDNFVIVDGVNKTIETLKNMGCVVDEESLNEYAAQRYQPSAATLVKMIFDEWGIPVKHKCKDWGQED